MTGPWLHPPSHQVQARRKSRRLAFFCLAVVLSAAAGWWLAEIAFPKIAFEVESTR